MLHPSLHSSPLSCSFFTPFSSSPPFSHSLLPSSHHQFLALPHSLLLSPLPPTHSPIKQVSIVSHKDVWPHFKNVIKETTQQRNLQGSQTRAGTYHNLPKIGQPSNISRPPSLFLNEAVAKGAFLSKVHVHPPIYASIYMLQEATKKQHCARD